MQTHPPQRPACATGCTARLTRCVGSLPPELSIANSGWSRAERRARRKTSSRTPTPFPPHRGIDSKVDETAWAGLTTPC